MRFASQSQSKNPFQKMKMGKVAIYLPFAFLSIVVAAYLLHDQGKPVSIAEKQAVFRSLVATVDSLAPLGPHRRHMMVLLRDRGVSIEVLGDNGERSGAVMELLPNGATHVTWSGDTQEKNSVKTISLKRVLDDLRGNVLDQWSDGVKIGLVDFQRHGRPITAVGFQRMNNWTGNFFSVELSEDGHVARINGGK